MPSVLSNVYDSGLLNDVADSKVGGTYTTFFACIMNFSGLYPRTFGLFIVDYTGVLALSIICFIITGVMMFAGLKVAKDIDNTPVRKYHIIKVNKI